MSFLSFKDSSEIINHDFSNTLVISSLAGTGKTTLLENFAMNFNSSKILYLVFNRAMLIEAATRFIKYPNVRIETFHSLARKSMDIQEERISENIRILDMVPFVAQEADMNVDFCRDVMSSLYLFVASDKSIEHYLSGIEDLKLKQAIELLWNGILSKNTPIPYLHEYYLKEYQLSKPDLSGYDYIFVDEAQDLTLCMCDIVLSQSCKKVFIGDPYQEVYKWRHSVNIIAELENKYDSFKLTKSFRCSDSVAKSANCFLKILGEESDFIGTNSKEAKLLQKTYIARTNLGLFKKAIQIPANEKIFYVGGISGYNFDLLKDIYWLFNDQQDLVSSAFMKSFTNKQSFMSYAIRAKEQDLMSLCSIIQKTPGIAALLDKIMAQVVENINEASIILTTAHKSKGLEFDNVELLDDFYDIKKAMVMKTKIPVEEIKLIYVAITRAKYSVIMPKKLELNPVAIEKLKSVICN